MASRQSEETVLKIQKIHQKASFNYLNKALGIDENGKDVADKKKAVELYKKGIEELQKGVNVIILGEGPDFERARGLRSKMQNNLIMAQDRLQVLGVSNEINRQTPTTKTSSATKTTTTNLITPTPSLSSPSSSSPRELNYRKSNFYTPSGKQAGAGDDDDDGDANNNHHNPTPNLSSLKNVDRQLLNVILNEIIDSGPALKLSDVAGQETSKQALHEIVILPSLRPELFTGLRTPARGLLLFGPPGNGKTMLARAVAHESKWTFFNISSASLTSKWMGEGEKLVRALFAAARHLQPSVIFIDEIDSLLCERKENEHEASRRIKTQFMIEFQGNESSGPSPDRLLVIGATNRPFELDDAVLRRFPKRIFVPMPDLQTRFQLLERLLRRQNESGGGSGGGSGWKMSRDDVMHVANLTEGYSSSDLTSLAKDAAMGPIRELDLNRVKNMNANNLRDIEVQDFTDSLRRIRPSVPPETTQQLQSWNKKYGDVSL
ncbi:hypothetical protein HELRODRAFT_85555 [Helobdella robusta]|uniref:microtubule-severing ATPase n=1 Tax=Helobdella robusta TaxID=6412 RepID=T1G5Z1_HELRO|nr:hypothetical protein HELRODRAFT_85555 [Helobdella robusta]ESN97427.1 hypothetical protein HELRODRAFT_85555 [Helobdella robusta]